MYQVLYIYIFLFLKVFDFAVLWHDRGIKGQGDNGGVDIWEGTTYTYIYIWA